MPDTYAILVNIPYPVKRYAMLNTVTIDKLKKKVIVRTKIDSIKRQAHNMLLDTIKVSYLKHPFGKFRVPVNTINQLLNGLHNILVL